MKDIDEIDCANTKGKRKGTVLFIVGLILLLVVSYGGWYLAIFVFSQVFLVIGLVIRTIFAIRERKRHPVDEPKWVKHLRI